jgi:arylsulfatase A-like enzyme
LATIASIDDSVGEILQFLDDNNLAENTMVIYTSDQGFFLGEHGWFDKRFIYEESFQMPFLVRYPAKIRPGQVNKDICCNVDFAPTFLDYAQSVIPSYMQGVSLRPLFEGNTPEDWSQVAYHRYWMHKDPDHNAFAHYGIRTQRYKLIYWYNEGFDLPGTKDGGEDKEWELFDCLEDPMELFNLYNDHSYQHVVSQMKKLLEDKMLSIGDVMEHRG